MLTLCRLYYVALKGQAGEFVLWNTFEIDTKIVSKAGIWGYIATDPAKLDRWRVEKDQVIFYSAHSLSCIVFTMVALFLGYINYI